MTAALPDDIEQYLIAGQLRATVTLAQWRAIPFEEVRQLVEHWLFRQERPGEGATDDR